MKIQLKISLFFCCPGSDSFPERRGVRKGNTVYVNGVGLVEDSLRSAFAQHGTIIDLTMDSVRKYDPIFDPTIKNETTAS